MKSVYNKRLLLSLLFVVHAHASTTDAEQVISSTYKHWLAGAAIGGSMAYYVQKRWIKKNRPQCIVRLYLKHYETIQSLLSKNITEIKSELMKGEMPRNVIRAYSTYSHRLHQINECVAENFSAWQKPDQYVYSHIAMSLSSVAVSGPGQWTVIQYVSPSDSYKFRENYYGIHSINLARYTLCFDYDGQIVLTPYKDLAKVVCKAILDPEKDAQKRIEKMLENFDIQICNHEAAQCQMLRELNYYASRMDYRGSDPKVSKKLPYDPHLIPKIIDFLPNEYSHHPLITTTKLQDLILNPGEDFLKKIEPFHADMRYLKLKDSSRWQDNVKAFWARN